MTLKFKLPDKISFSPNSSESLLLHLLCKMESFQRKLMMNVFYTILQALIPLLRGDAHFAWTLFFFQQSPPRQSHLSIILECIPSDCELGHEIFALFSFCHGPSPTLIYLYSQQLSTWMPYTAGVGPKEPDVLPLHWFLTCQFLKNHALSTLFDVEFV